MLRQTLAKIGRKVAVALEPAPQKFFKLCPALSIPEGTSERRLLEFLRSVRPANAPAAEMTAYCGEAFRRFLYTFGLVQDLTGTALELGSNPYFFTMLLRQFSRLELTLANYFGPAPGLTVGTQEVLFREWRTEAPARITLSYHHFNIEQDPVPFADASFNAIFFCEILEHLLHDPWRAVTEIKRVLKPKGVLILTTPNVNRLENRARLLAGLNIYDPYSGHGPYARHNREYNPSEIGELLHHAGFIVESLFTADVRANGANRHMSLSGVRDLLKRQAGDLGQYIFARARNEGPVRPGQPPWLYRHFPSDR